VIGNVQLQIRLRRNTFVLQVNEVGLNEKRYFDVKWRFLFMEIAFEISQIKRTKLLRAKIAKTQREIKELLCVLANFA
jgi:hypothetical protein